jgi:hypothetical protein
VRFYVGTHRPNHAIHFARCMVSVNVLRKRKSDLEANEWMMDSGAFTEISQYGDYRTPPEAYAEQINRWSRCGRLVAAVSQDYMCEPFILDRTGLTVEEHQARTIERYDRTFRAVRGVYLLPVLQGFEPAEYVRHLESYGSRLMFGAWCGVGSVCKRNTSPAAIEAVLLAIKRSRPDLRLHGFGVKLTALASSVVRSLLWSADSMAWSYNARRNGRDANDWREAAAYVERVEKQPIQEHLFAGSHVA